MFYPLYFASFGRYSTIQLIGILFYILPLLKDRQVNAAIVLHCICLLYWLFATPHPSKGQQQLWCQCQAARAVSVRPYLKLVSSLGNIFELWRLCLPMKPCKEYPDSENPHVWNAFLAVHLIPGFYFTTFVLFAQVPSTLSFILLYLQGVASNLL